MARPQAVIDYDLLEKLCQFTFKQEDIAWLLKVDLDTLCKYVKLKYDMSLSEFTDKSRNKLRHMLFQKQIDTALNGNVTMLIWLGKQLLEQSESPQKFSISAATEVKELSDSELEALVIKELMKTNPNLRRIEDVGRIEEPSGDVKKA